MYRNVFLILWHMQMKSCSLSNAKRVQQASNVANVEQISLKKFFFHFLTNQWINICMDEERTNLWLEIQFFKNLRIKYLCQYLTVRLKTKSHVGTTPRQPEILYTRA